MGAVYFIRVDHIGRPAFATDAAGVKVWAVSYDPFGAVTTQTGLGTPIRFPGQWFQSESGLHQNWMRDYDPTTGRYLQADPLGLVAGASVYGYALQNPGRYIDPRGENPAAAVCAIPWVAPFCGKVVQLCVEGIVIGGIVAIEWWNRDQAVCESCMNAEKGVIIDTPEGPIETFATTEEPWNPPEPPDPPEEPLWLRILGFAGELLRGGNGL